MQFSFFSLFLIFFISCNASSQEIKKTKGILNNTQKISLNQDSIQWNIQGIGYGIFDNKDNFLSISHWGYQSWVLHDLEGNPIQNYSKKYFKNGFEFPQNYTPLGFQSHQDTMYLFYPTKEIFVCVKDKIIKKIKLQLTENQHIFITSCFHYIPQTQEFVLSMGGDEVSYKKYFVNNNPLSFFDKNGKFLRSIGEYPKEYSAGHFFRHGPYSFRTHIENDKIYIMYAMFPTIYEYDLQGKLLRSFGQKSNEMNYKIQYEKSRESDISKSKWNDHYTGFGKVVNEDIFYYTFFVNHKHNPGGKYYIAKYDIKNKNYIEAHLNYGGSIRCLPKAEKDGVFVFQSSSQEENVFVNKYQITEQ